MLRLVFTYDKEVLLFDVDNRTITYRDRKWPNGVRFIPKDETFLKKVLLSRNRISNSMISWMEDANSGKSLEAFNACKDDNDIAEIVKRDARYRGCIFRKMFTGEELQAAENLSDVPDKEKGYVDSVPIEKTQVQEGSND